MNYWWSVVLGSVAAAALWALLDRLGWASWAFYAENALLFPLVLMFVSAIRAEGKRT